MKLKGKKKHVISFKRILILMIFLLSFVLTVKLLAKFSLPDTSDDFMRYLLENENVFVKNKKTNFSYFHDAMMHIIDFDIHNPISILNQNYKGLTSSDSKKEKKEEKTVKVENPYPEKERTLPTIYLYNTHQTEDYRATSFLEYSVNPNVLMVSYILQEQLEKKGYQVLVEEGNVGEQREVLGLNYAGSYEVTKTMMTKAKETYPSLTYFIDLHRDSISYDKTTLNINNTTYARILFIVGLENKTYQANLDFTNQIDTLLNKKLNGISKGIYKKEGAGVNGVYNQDFSPRTILIEMGGNENTIDEVYRSTILLGDVLDEVMKGEEERNHSLNS